MRITTLVIALVAAGCAAAAPVTPASQAPPPGPPPSFAVRVVGSGPPMILIPGLACGGDVWDGAVARWSSRYRMHILTLPGFAGQPPIAPPLLETVRRDLVRYIADQRLERPVIVGHSLGGFLAWWLAASAPDRVGPVISLEGLPFLSDLFTPGATIETARPQAELMRRMMAALTPEQFSAQNRAQLANLITNPADVEKVATTSARSDPASVGQALYEIMTTDLRAEVAALEVPSILVIGDGVDQAAATRQFKGADPWRMFVMGKTRHFVMLDAPERLFEAMEKFLADPAVAGARR